MKTYRERFIKNHKPEVQLADNKKGYRKILVYTGDYYTWEPKKGTLLSARRLYAVCEAVTIVLFLLSSIPGTLISYSRLVIAGALVFLVAWVFETFGTFSFCFRKLPLQEDDYAYFKNVTRITLPLRFVCMIFSFITGLIWLTEKGFETASILALIGYLLTGLIALFLLLQYIRLMKCVKVIPQ